MSDLRQTDVLDAQSFGNLVYIFRESSLPQGDGIVSDLSKILPVHRAALHGEPSSAERELIQNFLFPCDFNLVSVTAEI